MRLLCLSDTHIPDRCEELSSDIIKEIRQSDIIIHAGDITTLEYYKKLLSLKPMKASLGNMDDPELQKILKSKETFMCGKYKVGIMHGFGKPDTVLKNIIKAFDDTYQLVIFGHTHNPFHEKIGNTIYFNPGSPTDKIFAAYNSFGIIDIDNIINAQIIRL